jgi:hypothetical protein
MKIILPLSVTLPRKKKEDKVFTLNLNIYRNSHHFILNDAKIAYKEKVRESIVGMEKIEYSPLIFTYTLYPSSGRKFDLPNVCSIIDKFTCDALIEFGIIPDDSYKVIGNVIYKFGRVDKDNPRCELVIDYDLNKLPY